MSVITSALLLAASRCLNIGFNILTSSTTSYSCTHQQHLLPLSSKYLLAIVYPAFSNLLAWPYLWLCTNKEDKVQKWQNSKKNLHLKIYRKTVRLI